MKRQTRKMLGVGVTVVFLLGLLTGCDGKTSSRPESEAPARADRVSVTWTQTEKAEKTIGQRWNIY